MHFAVVFGCIAVCLAGAVTPSYGADDSPRALMLPVSLLAMTQKGGGVVLVSDGRMPAAHVLPVAMAMPASAIPEPAEPPATTGDGPAARPDLAMDVVQRLLRQLGFDAGPEDGIAGSRTRTAITAYQKSRRIPETGISDAAFNAQLHAEIRAGRPEAGGDAGTTPTAALSLQPAGGAPPASPALEQHAGSGTAAPLYSRAAGRRKAVLPPPDYTLASALWEFFSIAGTIAGSVAHVVSDAILGNPAPVTE